MNKQFLSDLLMRESYLDDGLGLTEHGGGVELRPVLSGHLVGHLEEEVHPLLDGDLLPLLLGLQRGRDRLLHELGRCVVELGDLLLVVMGLKTCFVSNDMF